jgi:hypothetical protein
MPQIRPLSCEPVRVTVTLASTEQVPVTAPEKVK